MVLIALFPRFFIRQVGPCRAALARRADEYPAVDGMDEVMLAAASLLAVASSPQEDTMDELLERLRWMLNLPVTATAEDIIAELNS